MKRKLLLSGVAAVLTVTFVGCKKEEGTTTQTTNATIQVQPDNTRVNARDRDDQTLTPEDQSASPADRELTQKVRQALVSSTNNFSVNARNVKVITRDGKVTLRGPVNSDAEKSSIVAVARSVAGESNVQDQLEVKANP